MSFTYAEAASYMIHACDRLDHGITSSTCTTRCTCNCGDRVISGFGFRICFFFHFWRILRIFGNDKTLSFLDKTLSFLALRASFLDKTLSFGYLAVSGFFGFFLDALLRKFGFYEVKGWHWSFSSGSR